MRYSYKKLYSWDADLSYLAGLVASDGCLANDGRHINVTSIDIEILESVIKILKLSVKIGQKPNGFGGMGHQVQFGDVALYDFLLNAGITPAKSKTILNVSIPDIYYRDFLRGLFDGDGTVNGFWDKRWKNSLMYYTEFTSSSFQFLKWIQSKNSRLGGLGVGRIRPNSRVSNLSYAKLDSQKLFEFMYYEEGLLALSRKRDKFVGFLKADPYINKALFGRVAE